ncbi:MAG: hypothetical protein WD041_00615 [Nitriliruptoraceae bacterium]
MRRRRALPGARAVVGGLLVAVAAVALFVTHLNATAPPSTAYLVASGPIAPGTEVADGAQARALFGALEMELPGATASRAFTVAEVDELAGHVVTSSLDTGDLVQRGVLVAVGEAPASHHVSFAVPRADALAGDVLAGQHVDVVATFTVAGEQFSTYVARGVQVRAVEADETGLGSREIVVTVSAADRSEVLALGHAARTAGVFLARPGPGAADDDVPGAHRVAGPPRDPDDPDPGSDGWADGFDPVDPDFATGVDG